MKLSRLVTARKARLAVTAALTATAFVPLGANAAARAADGCTVTPDKCYSFSMSVAGPPAPGDEAVYTGTLKNLSGGGAGVQLGSANITWSPTSAFYRVTAGSVSVSPAGSGTPSETVSGNRIELRNLNAVPGATVTFTFRAVALRQATITWSSETKQANQFLGLNNDLTQTNADPTTSISGSCSGSIAYNAYGCSGFPIAQGGTVCTDDLDNLGQPSRVTSCITFPPVRGASGIQVMALRSYLGGEDCLIGDCNYVIQLLNKLNAVYTGEYSASMSIDCGDLCGTVKAFLQQDEATGTNEPLLPCPVVDAPELLGSGPLASPLTGSTACFTDDGDSVSVDNITYLNDWKVMSIAVLE
jgi:hypothetical protein